MKKIIQFMFFFLLCSSVFAQKKRVNVDKLMVLDSAFLVTRWINEISIDALLADSSSRALVTEGAIKKFVLDQIALVPGSLSDGDKGDITVTASGLTWTIDPDVVTFSKIQNISTDRLLGRSTAGSGDIEEITIGSGLTLSAGELSASGGGAVSSVFGRTGAVVAATSDYDADQIDNTPSGGIAATTVQAAIDELDTEKLSAEVDGSITNEIQGIDDVLGESQNFTTNRPLNGGGFNYTLSNISDYSLSSTSQTFNLTTGNYNVLPATGDYDVLIGTGNIRLRTLGGYEIKMHNTNGIDILGLSELTTDTIFAVNPFTGDTGWKLSASGGDFSNGGDAGGANRSLGNTDDYDLSLLTNNLTRVFIDSTGLVGIGDSNPGKKLTVYDNTDETQLKVYGRSKTGTHDANGQIQVGGHASDFGEIEYAGTIGDLFIRNTYSNDAADIHLVVNDSEKALTVHGTGVTEIKEFQNGSSVAITNADSPYTLPDNITVIKADCTSGNITINVPDGTHDTREVKIIKMDSSGNTAILDPQGSIEINESTGNFTGTTVQYEWTTLIYAIDEYLAKN